MAASIPTRREIHVRVRDHEGALIRGCRITWSEDGEPRGTIESSDGHATLLPADQTSAIDIEVGHDGRTLRRKLAAGQDNWEFKFPTAQNMPSPSPSPSPVPTPVPPKAWSLKEIIVATIGALGLVAAAAVPFWLGSQDATTLTVYVRDAKTSAAIPNALVKVEATNAPAPKTTDGDGKVLFELKVKKNELLTIVGEAPDYEGDAKTAQDVGQPVYLRFKHKQAATEAPTSSVPAATPARPKTYQDSVVRGTWVVHVSGDIALKPIRSGSFDFSPQPDGSTMVRASFDLDGVRTKLDGQATRQGKLYFLDFSAKSENASWRQQGQLALSAQGQLTGHLVDAQGTRIPVTLERP